MTIGTILIFVISLVCYARELKSILGLNFSVAVNKVRNTVILCAASISIAIAGVVLNILVNWLPWHHFFFYVLLRVAELSFSFTILWNNRPSGKAASSRRSGQGSSASTHRSSKTTTKTTLFVSRGSAIEESSQNKSKNNYTKGKALVRPEAIALSTLPVINSIRLTHPAGNIAHSNANPAENIAKDDPEIDETTTDASCTAELFEISSANNVITISSDEARKDGGMDEGEDGEGKGEDLWSGAGYPAALSDE